MKTTPAEIAALIGGELQGPAGSEITGAMPLPQAGENDLAYLERAANAAWTGKRGSGGTGRTHG